MTLDLTAIRERSAAYQNFVDLRRAHTGEPGDPHVVTERAVAHYAKLSAADVASLLELLEQIRAAAPDMGLLRWCGWPDCWAHFNAADGPTVEGWEQAAHKQVLLCPNHADAGHAPDYAYDSTLRTLTAYCQCSDADVVQPGTVEAVLTWWRQHIRDDVTSHTSTGT